MHSDPIADMLNRLKNAASASHSSIRTPYSKQKKAILEVLKAHQFIKDFFAEKDEASPQSELKIELLSDKQLNVRRISKPGRRLYIKHKEIKSVKNGFGIAIMSTPKGIISHEQAKKNHLGGELICEIY